MVQRFRYHGVGDMGDRRQRNRLAAGAFDIVVVQLLGIEPISLLNLWNHLVGTIIKTEIIDIVSSEHGGKDFSYILHRKTELGSQIPVYDNLGLRQVIFQVAVEKHEHAAFLRLL